MKKIVFSMLLCGVIILGFTGCDKKENPQIENENIVFRFKDEVKEEMMNSSDTFNTILNDMDDNPLVDEFIITLKDMEKKEEIIKLIKNIDMVDNILS